MQTALLIAIPGGAAFTLFAWSLSRLSSDAVALALGLTLGVLSIIPSLWLVTLARGRDAEDYAGPDYIDVQPTYADQVTPYTHAFRRAVSLQPLLPRQDPDVVLRTYLDQMETAPNRQAEIDQLRAALNYIEAQEVTR